MSPKGIFLEAALGQKTIRPPVWLMRQAGRYMPEYRAIRSKYSFMEMMKNPEVATQVTMLPIDLLGVDAAIMFCDILVTAEALGSKLNFVEGKGPVFERKIRSASDIDSLRVPEPAVFDYVYQMIKLVKKELKNQTPLFGFAGAPFTVMSYLVEGGSSPDLKNTKILINTHPELAKKLLDKITEITILYLQGQIAVGVDALQLFDSWADVLSFADYQEFAHPYVTKIISALNQKVPIISFCKGSSVFYPLMAQSGANVLSLDWNCDLKTVKSHLPKNIAVQGNLDPFILYAPQSVIKTKTTALLESMRGEAGYIFNLGHGLSPDMPFENVKFLVDVVKSFK
jgi:uroporphyrinogen decarboxylase